MKTHCFILTILLCCISFFSPAQETTIRIACVGNSITYGSFIPNRELNSFPAQLQACLGEEYKVGNFGVSGSTLLSRGDRPYIQTGRYQESLEFLPDIVLIKLGTNDTKLKNRPFLDEYKKDYLSLISSYEQIDSNPRIILLTPIRSFLTDENSISEDWIQSDIIPVLQEIAYEKNLEIINLHNLFGDQWEEHLLPDRIHPSSIGAGMIANYLGEYLTTPLLPNSKGIGLFPYAEEFNYYGFKAQEFDMDDVTCRVVEPKRVAEGSPWIWRARFWGHEPQTEIALLEKGFHVAYCDVADLYGSEEALNRWNIFYREMTKAGLNRQVVLEGMSRGGLIVYNWAARNPEKVACIYADAPVMDIKSWPMGNGAGSGSKEDLKRLIKAYGFTGVEEVKAWRRNPVDQAKIFALNHIPILHVVGEDDEVVPVTENTDLFEHRLKKEGGSMTIIRKPDIGHHPHSLNNPAPIVKFILKATGLAQNPCIRPVPGNEFRSGAGWSKNADWHEVAQDICSTLENKDLKILLLGNSITQGFGGNREKVSSKPGKTSLDRVLGENTWESAGISGDRTQNLLWRIKHNNYNRATPDVVLITIGINNLTAGDDPADVAKGIEACAKEAGIEFPQARIILLGVLPAGENPDSPLRQKCRDVHNCLSQVNWSGIEYINPYRWFIYPDELMKTDLYGGDHLHLSAEGYREWSRQIGKLVNP